jgi:tRNA 2-selenouridine synthase
MVHLDAHAQVPMVSVGAVRARPPRLLVDLRSPGEFDEDHLPGAVNVPLFDDAERALIGTLYARQSPAEAFAEGARCTRAKIAALVGELARLAGWEPAGAGLEARVEALCAHGIEGLEHTLAPEAGAFTPETVVLYCWRGGLRSRSMVAFLRALGRTDVCGIEGGYRSYRADVRARIEGWRAPESFVLRGLTGVGKTLVLRELARLRPTWVLDLELLAGHRSSILGMVGLAPASQKLFESRLAARFEAGLGPVCVVEGESRKVGDIELPRSVWRAIDEGVPLELVAPTERRVTVLCDDYLASPESRAELARQLPFIEARLGPEFAGQLVALLDAARERELVELLLARYYDPLYRHSETGRSYQARFETSDPRASALAIAHWIEARLATGAARPVAAAPSGL